jgi:hypothetical protein
LLQFILLFVDRLTERFKFSHQLEQFPTAFIDASPIYRNRCTSSPRSISTCFNRSCSRRVASCDSMRFLAQ